MSAAPDRMPFPSALEYAPSWMEVSLACLKCLLHSFTNFSHRTGSISTTSNSGLRIAGATTVDLFYDAETAFQWSSETLYKNEVQKKLQTAVSRGFPFLKDQAVKDHSSLTKRVELDLGPASTNAKLPTDYRIDAYRANQSADLGFITLAFNFGRHLLVSSSRNTGGSGLGVPANLQGIWNDKYNPPW